ncbi:MAG: glycosyltransferase [Paludibacter sp.]|jgi:glycosyltransferase involved in cell wall biosynthesis|nr:glycosyltransferase [Paludibacter sp.]
MENNCPKISIITVVFNNVSQIEETILSVVNQTYSNIEYIVIDGGSTDGTVDIIKKYAEKITYWISEPDGGIYHAMNKGVEKASGEWVTNVNVGDVLLEIPVDVLQTLDADKYDALCGSVVLDNKKIIKPQFNWKILIFNTLPHQGLYYNRKKLYAKYDVKYSVYADFAYNIGMYQRKQKVYLTDKILCLHTADGISNNRQSSKELFALIKEQNGWFFEVLSFIYFKYQGLKFRIATVISAICKEKSKKNM